MGLNKFVLILIILSLFASCEKELLEVPENKTAALSIKAESVNFAVIGDFGKEGDNALAVSELVKSWNPNFVLTLGDNNYKTGELSTIKDNLGQYYCDFIYNPDAPEYLQCNGAAAFEKQNRFFPSLGNHDQESYNGTRPYETFFSLPGNEIFYDFEWGPVQFFVINSGDDTDHNCCDSEQSIWLKEKLANSTKTFKVVYFHHPPYSTAERGNNEEMQWPFREWGADAVLAGHDHNYERINEKGVSNFVYIVNGLGGKSIRDCNVNPLDADRFDSYCYNDNYGAMYCSATEKQLKLQFFAIDDRVNPIDEYVIRK